MASSDMDQQALLDAYRAELLKREDAAAGAGAGADELDDGLLTVRLSFRGRTLPVVVSASDTPSSNDVLYAAAAKKWPRHVPLELSVRGLRLREGL